MPVCYDSPLTARLFGFIMSRDDADDDDEFFGSLDLETLCAKAQPQARPSSHTGQCQGTAHVEQYAGYAHANAVPSTGQLRGGQQHSGYVGATNFTCNTATQSLPRGREGSYERHPPHQHQALPLQQQNLPLHQHQALPLQQNLPLHQHHAQRPCGNEQQQQQHRAPAFMPQPTHGNHAAPHHGPAQQAHAPRQAPWLQHAYTAGNSRSNNDSGGSSGPGAQPCRSRSGSGGAEPRAGSGSSAGTSMPSISYTATVGLESGTHLHIKIGAHQRVDTALRGIMGVTYDRSNDGRWLVPLASYQASKQALDNMEGLRIVWNEMPGLVMSIIKAAHSVRDDTDRFAKLLQPCGSFGKASLEERMMEFQKEGVQFALRKGGRVLIGDEMGLGKTVQACALLQCYSDEWPALIIVPSSLKCQWADSLKLWLGVGDQDVLVVHNSKDANKLRSARIAVVSYDIVSKVAEQLSALKPQVVIADEAHYIKTHTSKRSQATLPLLQQARRAVLLSGTPALSKPSELIPLLQAVLPKAKINRNDFAARYCQGDRFSKFTGAKNQEELNRLITSCVMIRRRKAEVLPQLPAKRRQLVYLSMAAEDVAAIKKQADELSAVSRLMGTMQHRGQSATQGLGTEQMMLIGRLYVATAEAKVKAVQAYIRELLEADEEIKFLVFAHHRCLIDAIDAQCTKSNVDHIRIDGGTNSKVRDDLRKRFQENPRCRVAVLSIQAAGTGLTLTAASTVLFAELTWVPGEVLQAEDRVHRIGQQNSVNIQFLMARNSIDDLIWQSIQSKLDNVGMVLDGKQDSLQVASRHIAQPSDSWEHGRPSPTRRPDGVNGTLQQQGIRRFFPGREDDGCDEDPARDARLQRWDASCFQEELCEAEEEEDEMAAGPHAAKRFRH